MSSAKKTIRDVSQIRKRRFIIKAVTLFCLVSVISYGAIHLLRSDKFSIRDIEVIGASTINEKELLGEAEDVIEGSYFGVIPKNSALLYPRRELRESLKKYSIKIKEVALGQDELGHLKISIIERYPSYLWCKENIESDNKVCYYADDTGFIYEKGKPGGSFTEFKGGDASEKILGSSILDREKFIAFKEILKELTEQDIFVSDVLIDEHRDYRLKTSSGFDIYLAENKETEDTLRNLNLSLVSDFIKPRRDELLYVDLRFGDKVYYKFREEITLENQEEILESIIEE